LPGLAGGVLQGPGRAAGRLAGARRTHGPDQLPDAVGGLHPGVLRLWPGLVRPAAARLARAFRAGAVRAAGTAGPRLAGALPLRPDGMAVALGHLPAPAADAPARAARGRLIQDGHGPASGPAPLLPRARACR